MINNDVLRSVRFMLDLHETGLSAIFKLGGAEVGVEQLRAFLKREDEAGFVPCDHTLMGRFLDGLIIQRRGPPTGAPRAVERAVSNNVVLKKLRVAFELKEEDLLELMKSQGFEVSRPALSALFRKPDHHNYRPCGDQFLRNFLKSLTARVRLNRADGSTAARAGPAKPR